VVIFTVVFRAAAAAPPEFTSSGTMDSTTRRAIPAAIQRVDPFGFRFARSLTAMPVM